MTNGVVGNPRDDGYTATRFVPTSCVFEGRCREWPFNWELISNGTIVSYKEPVLIQSCGCYQCIDFVYCEITINGSFRSVYLG